MRTLKYGGPMAGTPNKSKALTALARSPIAWLQAGVLAVLAWGFFHAATGPAPVATRPASAPAAAAMSGTGAASTTPGAANTTSTATAAAAAAAAAAATATARQSGSAVSTAGSDSGSAPASTAALAQFTFQVKVGRNDTLERIFRRMRLSLADLATLRALPGLKEDLDRLRPGEALTFVAHNGVLDGLTRRLSLQQTLKVVRNDAGFQANVLANSLDTRTVTVAGRIDSSLFEAVTAAGADDQTTMALADIFAWDIDFLKDIQPGDSFTVTYQRIFEAGKYLQDGPILAARFVNQGHEYLAVRYVSPDGRSGYYSPEGRSLRKAFLRAPLAFTRVSSPFSLHRRHPILNLIRAHKGVDYAAPIGTPVHAAGDGRVVFAGRMGGYGNMVQIQHTGGIMTVYGHLSRFAHGIRRGSKVEQNEVIAYVGMTGLATGPHLHFEFRVNGVYKNPQTVKLPDAVPIDERLRPDFLAQTGALLASLFPPVGPALVSR